MGIAALVLGIVSIIIAFIPLCGSIAFVPAIIGVILGIIDIVLKSKKKEKMGVSIAGLILSILAIIIIVLWLFVIGAGSEAAAEQLANQTDNTVNNTEKEVKQYALNEPATLGDGEVTVTKVEKSQGTKYDKPKDGKEYIIVHVTIKNNGSKNLSYNPFYFKMQNSQGQQEDKTISMVDQDTALLSGELTPGGTVSGTIVFEEPVNDNNLILIYQDNVWSNNMIKIAMQ